MMEEQNQEKATATQHVTVADAAAPETGNGKKEDKGGGKKEKKTAKPLTPKQLQQRKKLMVYPLMGLLFLGSMWLIFAPSEERDVNRDTVGAFNADIPLPENDGIIGDKRKAYEQAQAEKQQAEKVRSLEDFAFSEESDMDGVEMELPDSEPEREPFRDYSDNGGGSRSSVTAYRDINRQLGSFYEEPKVDGEKEELKRQVEELTAKLEERERQAGGIDDQVALMEKSYELAAKYMGQNGKDGAAVQNDNSPRQPAVAVQVARERTVSGLQQPLSDAEFMRRYSQPRNYGFNRAKPVTTAHRLRVVVAPDRIQQAAAGHKAALRNRAFPQDDLPGERPHAVRVLVEVAPQAVYLYHLVDVPRDYPVVIPLFREVLVVVEGALVRQQQRAFDIALDSRLVGREREEQLVEAAHVLPCLHRAVLPHVLRERQHQALAVVQHVDLLPLRLGEAVRLPQGEARHHGAQAGEYQREEPYLPEARFDIFQTLKFHVSGFLFVMTHFLGASAAT